MGVLACSRNGCDAIMCDRYSPVYGYICPDCFSELVASGAEVDIQEFLDSEKKYSTSDLDRVQEKFDEIFPVR